MPQVQAAVAEGIEALKQEIIRLADMLRDNLHAALSGLHEALPDLEANLRATIDEWERKELRNAQEFGRVAREGIDQAQDSIPELENYTDQVISQAQYVA